jgi:RimJ/RimL family protein N-acetyltransferase
MFAKHFSSTRCTASRIQLEDWSDFLKAVSSDKFPAELPLSKITTEQAAQDWHADRIIDWDNKKCFVWSIRFKSSPEVIGQLSLLPREHDIALAYWVNPALWGQGIITEITKALMQSITDSGYRGTIWAGAHPWNQRSFSVLIKLGFEFQKESEYIFKDGRIEKIKEYILSIKE